MTASYAALQATSHNIANANAAAIRASRSSWRPRAASTAAADSSVWAWT